MYSSGTSYEVRVLVSHNDKIVYPGVQAFCTYVRTIFFRFKNVRTRKLVPSKMSHLLLLLLLLLLLFRRPKLPAPSPGHLSWPLAAASFHRFCCGIEALVANSVFGLADCRHINPRVFS